MLENGYLLAMNALLAAVILLGAVVNGWMMFQTRARRRLVRNSGENGIALLTVSRAVRNETTYFAIQIILFATTFFAVFRVAPNPDHSVAFQFYLATLGARASVSLLLMWSSWADLRDRHTLHEALNKLNVIGLQGQIDKLQAEPAKVEIVNAPDNPVPTEDVHEAEAKPSRPPPPAGTPSAIPTKVTIVNPPHDPVQTEDVKPPKPKKP